MKQILKSEVKELDVLMLSNAHDGIKIILKQNDALRVVGSHYLNPNDDESFKDTLKGVWFASVDVLPEKVIKIGELKRFWQIVKS